MAWTEATRAQHGRPHAASSCAGSREDQGLIHKNIMISRTCDSGPQALCFIAARHTASRNLFALSGRASKSLFLVFSAQDAQTDGYRSYLHRAKRNIVSSL